MSNDGTEQTGSEHPGRAGDDGAADEQDRGPDEHLEDQLQPEDTLVDRGVEDVLDEGYSPADTARGSTAWGTTAWEQSHDETIEQRILQEVPDPDSAYGAPDNESGLDRLDDEMVGGDDPDAIRAEDDVLGDTGQRSGRLVAPDEGTRDDVDAESVADDVGYDGAGSSAEEAAVHVVDDRDLDALAEDDPDDGR